MDVPKCVQHHYVPDDGKQSQMIAHANGNDQFDKTFNSLGAFNNL